MAVAILSVHNYLSPFLIIIPGFVVQANSVKGIVRKMHDFLFNYI